MLPIGTKLKCIRTKNNTYWIDTICIRTKNNTYWIDTIVGYTRTTNRYITKEGYYINRDLKLEGLNIDNITYTIAICKVHKPFKRYKRR